VGKALEEKPSKSEKENAKKRVLSHDIGRRNADRS
jgi:hypothetical protein